MRHGSRKKKEPGPAASDVPVPKTKAKAKAKPKPAATPKAKPPTRSKQPKAARASTAADAAVTQPLTFWGGSGKHVANKRQRTDAAAGASADGAGQERTDNARASCDGPRVADADADTVVAGPLEFELSSGQLVTETDMIAELEKQLAEPAAVPSVDPSSASHVDGASAASAAGGSGSEEVVHNSGESNADHDHSRDSSDSSSNSSAVRPGPSHGSGQLRSL